MRLLYVVPYVPSRIRVRSYEFIRNLAERHNVTVICLVSNAHDQQDVVALREIGLTVHSIPHRPIRGITQALWRGSTGASLQVAYAASRPLARAVERLAPHMDLVHLEHLRGTGELFKTGDVPVVWDAVDCISLLLSEMSRSPQPLHVRALQRIESPRTERHEADMLRRYAQIIVTAPRDGSVLRSLDPAAPTDITVVPNGVDLSYFSPRIVPQTTTEILFTGKMSYHANRIAVQTFAEQIWPRVRAARPDARFVVAGKDPSREIRRLHGRAGITVTGYVPDIRPYLARAAIAIVPLVYSVGNPNKVLEAMAMAIPVVATPAAVTSLDTVHATGIVVAEADTIAQEIIRLLETPAERMARGQQGRAYVEAERSWYRATTMLEQVYEIALTDHHARTRPLAIAAD